MICPHCGNETSDGSIQCEHCGAAVSRGVNWGVRKSSNTYQPQYSSDTEKLTSFVAASPTLHKSKPKALKIVAGLAAIALVLGVGWMGFSAAQSASSSSVESSVVTEQRTEARLHDVKLAVQAPELDEKGTLIALQLTGADAGNNAVDETVFIKPDGTGLRLPAGNYGVRPLASPITAQGGLFLYNGNNKWFSVDAELEEGAVVDASEDVKLVFDPADPSDISNEAIDAARQYAIEGGMAEAEVDKLLEAVRASMEEAKAGDAFSNVQSYRGITFAGDVRTNTGFVPIQGVPDVQPIITRTDSFLFTGNNLYYVDNALSGDYGQVALHSRNMSTGQESILATDVAKQSFPCYTNGQIIYTANEWGQAIKRIDLASGETISMSDILGWDYTKLIGVKDGMVVAATGDGTLPQVCVAPLGEGEARYLSLGEAYGNVVGMFDDRILVNVSDWSSSRLAAYDLEGTLLWEHDIADGTQLGKQWVYHDNVLAAVSSGGSAVVRVDMNTGESQVYDSNVAYLFEVMYVTGGHIYFAGSNSYANYDNNGTALASYTTFDIDTSTGSIAELGSYEAPQDEDLAQQQQNMYWNDSYNNTWGNTDYDTTTEGGTGTETGTEDGTTNNNGAGYGLDPSYGDWDANGAYVGGGRGGYDANGNLV